jgi:hypothetical protein
MHRSHRTRNRCRPARAGKTDGALIAGPDVDRSRNERGQVGPVSAVQRPRLTNTLIHLFYTHLPESGLAERNRVAAYGKTIQPISSLRRGLGFTL